MVLRDHIVVAKFSCNFQLQSKCFNIWELMYHIKYYIFIFLYIFFYFHRLLPQAIWTSQKIHRCSGVNMEAYSHPSKNYIDPRFSSGWSETKSLFSEKSLKKYLMPSGALVTSKTQDVSNAPIVGDDKIGVLLLNLGGPETLEDVQPFLFNLFADPVMSSWFVFNCLKYFYIPQL